MAKKQHPLKKQHPSKKKQKDNRDKKAGLHFLATEQTGIPLHEDNQDLCFHLSGDHPGKDSQLPEDGYVVVFENRHFKRLLDLQEFFQLDLPEHPTEKTLWKVHFRGKKESESGAVILSAEALRYILVSRSNEGALSPGYIVMHLNKLDFEQKNLFMKQGCPLEEGKPELPSFMQKIILALSWSSTLPLKEFRDSSLRNLSFMKENPLFRLAFLATAIAFFVLLPILSLNAGLSGDDQKHYEHAALVYKYYTEDDPAALDTPYTKLNYYGQSFDFFTYLLIKWFGLDDDPYKARHVMVALSGATAILFTGLLVKLFAGYSGGLLAMILMFLSPRFLGHAFNNPMDIPFLLGNVFTLYHLILFLKKLPHINIRSSIWIAAGIGWTVGIRIGGLLLVPYLFLFAGLYLLVNKWPWKSFSKAWWGFALKGLLTLVLISLAGYFLSILTWPYALQDIINHPAQAFRVMTDIQVSLRVMYDGMVHWSDKLPWHYIPRNVFQTVPAIILLGCLASLATAFFDGKGKKRFWYFMLWFTILFPVLFIIVRKSNVYGGWRHMMFIYPSILALSAMAFNYFFRILQKSRMHYILLLLILAGLIHPLKHIVRNHPNTYIYFNELAGGINSVFGKQETDFFASSLGSASSYFIENILPGIKEGKKEEPARVISNGDISYYFRNHRDHVRPVYSRFYDRGKYDWDYAILYCNYIDPWHLQNGFWPPRNTIHEIRVDDVVVAAIVERKNKADFYGASLLTEGMETQNFETLYKAQDFLESALEYNPQNIGAHLDLANLSIFLLEFEKARSLMEDLLEVFPEFDKAYNMIGYSYIVEAEYNQDMAILDEAIRWINRAIGINYKFYSGYYNLGLCYGMRNDFNNAEYNLKEALKHNARFVEAYEQLADLYEAYGDIELAKVVRKEAARWR